MIFILYLWGINPKNKIMKSKPITMLTPVLPLLSFSKSYYKKVSWLLFTMLIGFSALIHGQPQIFSRVLESNGSVQITDMKLSDHNTYFGIGFNYNTKGLLFEMDSSAQVIWARTFENVSSGTSRPIQLSNMIPTDDSGFLLTGNTFRGASGWEEDAFVMKIDSQGEVVWSKAMTNDFRFFLNDAFQTDDHGFIVSGHFTHASAPYSTIALVRLDEFGNLLWIRELILGSSMNKAYAVKQIEDGSIMITGHYNNQGTTGTYAFLANLNSEGEVVWAQNYYYESSYAWCQGNDFVTTGTGYLVTMYLNSYLMMGHTDFTGNLLSYKLYRNMGSETYYDQAAKFHPLEDGGFMLVVGDNYSSTFIKTDSIGNVLWKDDLFLLAIDACVTNNNEYLIFGNGPIMGVKSIEDMYQQSIGLIQVDTVGNGIDCASFNPLIPTAEDTIARGATTATSTARSAVITEVALETAVEEISTREGCIDFVGSVNEFISAKLELFPNPTQGSFTVLLDCELEGKLVVYNTFGDLVLTQNIFEKSTRLDLTGQAKGMYFYQFVVDDKPISKGKIVLAY